LSQNTNSVFEAVQNGSKRTTTLRAPKHQLVTAKFDAAILEAANDLEDPDIDGGLKSTKSIKPFGWLEKHHRVDTTAITNMQLTAKEQARVAIIMASNALARGDTGTPSERIGALYSQVPQI
jgi:hypothetical protein